MNKNLTELVIVLDKSTSMFSMKLEAEQAIQSLIREQINQDGEINLTLYQFNQRVSKVMENCPSNIIDVDTIKIEPSGMTALYDAMGTAIDEVGQRLAKTPENERPGLVMVVIVTDGLENSSREYSPKKVEEMVKHQEQKYNWVFDFLATTPTFAAQGGYINTSTDFGTIKGAMEGYSMKVGRVRRASMLGEQADLSFTKEEERKIKK